MVGFVRQRREVGAGFHSRPEYAGRVRIWKKAEFANMDRDRCVIRHRREGGTEFRDLFLRPLADKPRGDVKIGRRAPLNASVGSQPSQKLFQITYDFRRDIQTNEQSHERFSLSDEPERARKSASSR